MVSCLCCEHATVVQPPTNDDFANAATLFDGGTAAPGNGSITGTTTDATVQIDEPRTGAYAADILSTVWYKWIAPTTAVDMVYTATFGVRASTGGAFTFINVYQQSSANAGSTDPATLTLHDEQYTNGNTETAQAPPLVITVAASSTTNVYVRVGAATYGGTVEIDFTVSWGFRGE
jgi:hypothetical protein